MNTLRRSARQRDLREKPGNEQRTRTLQNSEDRVKEATPSTSSRSVVQSKNKKNDGQNQGSKSRKRKIDSVDDAEEQSKELARLRQAAKTSEMKIRKLEGRLEEAKTKRKETEERCERLKTEGSEQRIRMQDDHEAIRGKDRQRIDALKRDNDDLAKIVYAELPNFPDEANDTDIACEMTAIEGKVSSWLMDSFKGINIVTTTETSRTNAEKALDKVSNVIEERDNKTHRPICKAIIFRKLQQIFDELYFGAPAGDHFNEAYAALQGIQDKAFVARWRLQTVQKMKELVDQRGDSDIQAAINKIATDIDRTMRELFMVDDSHDTHHKNLWAFVKRTVDFSRHLRLRKAQYAVCLPIVDPATPKHWNFQEDFDHIWVGHEENNSDLDGREISLFSVPYILKYGDLWGEKLDVKTKLGTGKTLLRPTSA